MASIPLNLSDKQIQRYMNDPACKFAERFDKETDGMKIELPEDLKDIYWCRGFVIKKQSFSSFNMPFGAYGRLCTLGIEDLEWGLLLKLLHMVISFPPDFYDFTVDKYVIAVMKCTDYIDKINSFVEVKKNKVLKDIHAAELLSGRI